jgi:hypothetical protein
METWRTAPGRDAPTYDFVSMVEDGYKVNGIVFAVILARMSLFSEAEVKFRRLSDKGLFGSPELAPLESPWPGGTTGELLARMEQHASLGGQALVVRDGAGVKLLRPDWTRRVSEIDTDGQRRLLGYLYDPTGWTAGGPEGAWEEPVYYLADEVACYAPVPDPLNPWRGMSWLTPVIREINGDAAMNTHKEKFFENAATPNIVIRYAKKLPDGYVKAFAEQFDARHGGVNQSWRTVILDEAADLTVVGSSFEQMTFTDLQAAGETRIAAAGGVPPMIVGLREGLNATNYATYTAGMRRFADLTMRPNWRMAMGALSVLIDVPGGAKLWYDTTDIAALQEGEKERADASQVNAATLSTLITAGYTPESATRAVISGDFSLLQHSGLVSVQLQAPGSSPTAPVDAGRAAALELPAQPQSAEFHAHVNINDGAFRATTVVPDSAPVEPPVVNVTVERAETMAPSVTVNVEPTPVTVNVEPTPVTVTNEVESGPVTVNVEPTPVTVENQVTVETPAREVTTKVKRDTRGLITETTATERDVKRFT